MLDILVTGADGQLGRSLQRLGAVSPNRYHFTDRAQVDITDAEAVRAAAEATHASVIVNCAAYTAVDRAEEEPEVAELLNATAAGHLAAAAAHTGATLIHISTDYVFDGRGNAPLAEEAPTAPLNVYGRTKLRGEQAVAASGCRAITIRTAWLYSEYGNNFLKTMLRLTTERDHLRVVCDQTGTPTYAGDLALAIFSIIESGRYEGNEGLYHFSNEGVCSWYDFAAEIAAETGRDACRIEPCRTADYPTRAVRPAYTVLDKTKIKRTFDIEIPHWRDSMRYCMERLATQERRQ